MLPVCCSVSIALINGEPLWGQAKFGVRGAEIYLEASVGLIQVFQGDPTGKRALFGYFTGSCKFSKALKPLSGGDYFLTRRIFDNVRLLNYMSAAALHFLHFSVWKEGRHAPGPCRYATVPLSANAFWRINLFVTILLIALVLL